MSVHHSGTFRGKQHNVLVSLWIVHSVDQLLSISNTRWTVQLDIFDSLKSKLSFLCCFHRNSLVKVLNRSEYDHEPLAYTAPPTRLAFDNTCSRWPLWWVYIQVKIQSSLIKLKCESPYLSFAAKIFRSSVNTNCTLLATCGWQIAIKNTTLITKSYFGQTTQWPIGPKFGKVTLTLVDVLLSLKRGEHHLLNPLR